MMKKKRVGDWVLLDTEDDYLFAKKV